MSELRFTPEVSALVSELKNTALGDDHTPETLKNAWKKYIEINKKVLSTEMFDIIKRDMFGSLSDILDRGGVKKPNSVTQTATAILQKDLGLRDKSGMMSFSPEETEKVTTFFNKMSEVLIKPRT